MVAWVELWLAQGRSLSSLSLELVLPFQTTFRERERLRSGWRPGGWEGTRWCPQGGGPEHDRKQQLHTFPGEQRAEFQCQFQRRTLLTVNPPSMPWAAFWPFRDSGYPPQALQQGCNAVLVSPSSRREQDEQRDWTICSIRMAETGRGFWRLCAHPLPRAGSDRASCSVGLCISSWVRMLYPLRVTLTVFDLW